MLMVCSSTKPLLELPIQVDKPRYLAEWGDMSRMVSLVSTPNKHQANSTDGNSPLGTLLERFHQLNGKMFFC